jgi:DNA-binding NtrC family response regulator
MTALRLAQKHAPLTPLILWTGSLSEDIAVDCMKAGANNYIIKENIKRLGPAVIHALEEKSLRIEREKAQAELRLQSEIIRNMAKACLAEPDRQLSMPTPSLKNTGRRNGEDWKERSL